MEVAGKGGASCKKVVQMAGKMLRVAEKALQVAELFTMNLAK